VFFTDFWDQLSFARVERAWCGAGWSSGMCRSFVTGAMITELKAFAQQTNQSADIFQPAASLISTLIGMITFSTRSLPHVLSVFAMTIPSLR